jgi:aconitate hydratase
MGALEELVSAGARVHQTGCLGCIGMGQAPATDTISLRTMPRNFPGRSGVKEDKVYLCSPETAAASALTGKITDPRELELDYPQVELPDEQAINTSMLLEPDESGRDVELRKGPNIATLPEFDAMPAGLAAPVLLKLGDDVSTDEILPAGGRVLPYRSNVPELATFVFIDVDESFHERAQKLEGDGGFVLVAGENYGQGSSREHAALVPRYLGLRAVIAKSFGRIHWQNLVNFGVVPLRFGDEADADRIDQDDELEMPRLAKELAAGSTVTVENRTKEESLTVGHDLSDRQVSVVLAGGLINHFKEHGPSEGARTGEDRQSD